MESKNYSPVVQELIDMIQANGWQDKFQKALDKCIIRKTKCSGFPKRNVPLPKTKRTFFSPLISDRHNPFQGCGGSVFMRL